VTKTVPVTLPDFTVIRWRQSTRSSLISIEPGSGSVSVSGTVFNKTGVVGAGGTVSVEVFVPPFGLSPSMFVAVTVTVLDNAIG